MKYQRQINLLQYINSKGNATIEELLKEFLVSKATLNRDLTDLVDEGSIQKVHGGVVSRVAAQVFELSSTKKEVYNKEYKEWIAKKAVSMIHSNESIILDSGSTMYYIARELATRTDLENVTVITNDLKVAYTLSQIEHISLIVTGGMKHPDSYDLYGPNVVDILMSLNANTYFMATSAFDSVSGVTHTNHDDIITKREMMKCSKETILCADSSKYGLVKRWSLCGIQEVKTILCDSHLPKEAIKDIKEMNVNLSFVDK